MSFPEKQTERWITQIAGARVNGHTQILHWLSGFVTIKKGQIQFHRAEQIFGKKKKRKPYKEYASTKLVVHIAILQQKKTGFQ